MKSKRSVYLMLISSAIAFTLVLSGCSSSKSTGNTSSSTSNNAKESTVGSTGINSNQAATSADAANPSSSSSTETTLQQQSNDKIIQTVSIIMETTTFYTTTNAILQKVSAVGGYVESSGIFGTSLTVEDNSQLRKGSFKLRIPKTSYEKFILDVGNLGNIINKTISSENVTLQYFDNEARLKSLQLQEQRLLDLLKNSGSLKDMLDIEKELANVRYQIENITSTQKKLDNLVDYATVNIDVMEVQKLQVKKASPVTLWQKMSTGFVDSIKSLGNIVKSLLVLISVILPYAVVLIVLGLPTYYLWKKVYNKYKNIK